TAIGTPASAGSGLPAATSASMRSACAYARSSQSVRYTFISLFFAAMARKCSAASSRAETFFAASASFTPRIVQFVVIFSRDSPFAETCHPEGRAVCGLKDLNPRVLPRRLSLNDLRHPEIRRLRIRCLFQNILGDRARHHDVFS